MMLYPPHIEGTIPAFCKNEKGNNILIVPFAMNKMVSTDSVWGFALRVKTVASNQLIYTTIAEANKDTITQIAFDVVENDFIGNHKLSIGQFYKIQIAYIQKIPGTNEQGETGYFSTVGVVKYTSKPELTIVDMDANKLHSDFGTYVGQYYNADTTEKLYTYSFNIYDNQGYLVATSGVQLHNHETDTEINKTIDRFTLMTALEDNKFYKIVYKGTTTNGMEVSSSFYRIVQQSSIPPEIDADVVATMNKENGYVQIRVQGHVDPFNGLEKNAIGTFQILRSSEIGNFNDWQVIKRFVLFGSPPSMVDIKDFTIEQGKSYKYALQQYNNDTNLVSDKIYSDIILSDFEDMFLYDGERQLKIKYNPKMSSFKQNLQETKTVTLGQKYPFILRNGKVDYKEFPIAGLISYHMDEEHLFINDNELGIDNYPSSLYRTKTLRDDITSKDTWYFDELKQKYGLNYAEQVQNSYIERETAGSDYKLITAQKSRTTSLIDYNMAAERIFKLKVLEFLNNGKPKLFRSPSEGNYIVRLMNSSLSPDDKLSRMLHSFSTTATEVKEFSTEALEDLKIINTKQLDTKQQRWETILLSTLVNAQDQNGWIKINRYTAYSLQCLDMWPGTQIRITYSDAPTDPLIIVIGSTGAYYSKIDREIEKIEIQKSIFRTSLQGQITYEFYGTTFNHFDTYKTVMINDIPLIQLVGEQRDDKNNIVDVKTKLTDIRNMVTNFNLLHFIKRDVIPVYKGLNDQLYYAPLNLRAETLEKLQQNQTAVNLSIYNEEYPGGPEFISWASKAPNKQSYWETLYYAQKGESEKGVVNIRSLLRSDSIGIDICYQTNIQLQEFKKSLEETQYNYVDSIRIIDADSESFNNKLNSQLSKYRPNDIIIVNGVTAYLCIINKDQKQWLEYPANLGTIVSLDAATNSWFKIENNDEYITEIKIRVPKLQKKENRNGYLIYETYLDLTEEEIKNSNLQQITEFDPLCIYKIINNANFDYMGFSEELYYDGNIKNYISYSNNIRLNDSYVDITETQEYQVTTPNDINIVYIPSGVLADIGVQRRTIEYGIETKDNYQTLITTKNEWQQAADELATVLYSEEEIPNYNSKLAEAREKEKEKYEQYITELEKQLNILAGEGAKS